MTKVFISLCNIVLGIIERINKNVKHLGVEFLFYRLSSVF